MFLEFIFPEKTLDSIIYIEWEWNLGRLKIFWFFLDEIVRNLQRRFNSTMKNEIYLMERDFLINWLFRTWLFEAATYLHLILMK